MTDLPVLVLQHQTQDHAAHLRTWLDDRRIVHRILDSERGRAYPKSIEGYRALAVLGGEYGANDDRASLRDAERLIEQAFARDVPVVGHCLGGQLMARVLGATVRRSPLPEIGWCPVRWQADAAVDRWFGETPPARVFQWHYDAFDLPSGATLLAESDACPRQAFAFGRHLAMQFHVEVDAPKLQAWLAATDAAYAAAQIEHPGTVQSVPAIEADTPSCLPLQLSAADRVYRHWLGF